MTIISMQNKLIVIFIILSSSLFAQITTTRMGHIKIGMRGKDIAEMHDRKTNYSLNNLKHQGAILNVELNPGYLSKYEGDEYVTIISTQSKNLKTMSNIGVGNTLEDLWNTYHSKYTIDVSKEDEGLRTFTLEDAENGTRLLFDLKNNIIIKISIYSYNPEECFI